MTDEEHSLLERTYKIAQENNAILRSIRRSNRISSVVKVLYWVIIIGVSYGAYYAIQPYFNKMLDLYTQIQSDAAAAHSTIDSVTSLKTLLPK